MLQTWLNKIKDWLKNNVFPEFKIALKPLIAKKKIIIASIIILIFGLLLGRINKALLFVPLLIILASFSMIYNLLIRLSLGFELIMLSTVLCSAAYGPVVGLIVGNISLFFAEILSSKMSYNTFISFIGISIVAVVGAGYSGEGITSWGIMMTILYDLIIIPLYLISGSNPISSIIYVVTHIPFNIWVFYRVAPWLFKIMTT
ncbi:MAG: hypothetical protein MAG795_00958 [Candidatus Woesearchaeota archaeon]|nr:hypothetical protein [Candidatus Woesearchaeota archaeon]